MTATATDNRKQRDVVASDIDNDRVVDQHGNPVPDIEHQETPPGVNDALLCAAESLVGFDRFESLPEAEAAGGNDEVRLAVEKGIGVGMKTIGNTRDNVVMRETPAAPATHAGCSGNTRPA